MRSTRFWVLAVAGLLAASLLAAVLVYTSSPGGTVAEIVLDGEVIRTIDLETARAETFVVQGEHGTNTVQVEPGRIRVEAADCPDQVCVHQGWISDGTVPIVCLPNRLVIRITGGSHPGLDGVAG